MTPDRWSQIERVYHLALERAEGERDNFLTEACAGDEALRREVESLLAHDGKAAFLSTPAVAHRGGDTLVGQSLGPYVVSARIGEGGMGEVYRARDQALGRDVAIKVLPRAFTADAERLARFAREARVLAALNHPHIGAIYGLEDVAGTRGLVLELVEGPTLAERLSHGPLSINEALLFARQIAEALDAAHEKGIVHRDLKPAIIKVTPEGEVKVLDFGLAKATDGDGAAPDLTHTPTLTVGATREGMVLGTPAYMSPEQARGQAVDKRADIWAFGCVLYEMLTGRMAFPGETQSDTIVGILEHQPDWTALPAATPASVRRLLQRCLDKNARQRLRDIGDARSEIHEAMSAEQEPIATVARSSRNWPWIAAAMLILGAIGGWAVSRVPQPSTRESMLQLQIEAPEGGEFTRGVNDIALSPDGRTAVYIASVEGRTALWVRPLDGKTARRLPGTEDALNPFWSPDGKAVAFVKSGKLLRIDVAGGTPVTICDVNGIIAGGAWSSDGRILIGLLRRPLSQVSSAGGTLSPLTTFDASLGEAAHVWPQILPGGRFLYWAASTQAEHTDGVYAASLAKPQERVRLLTSKTNALYASSSEGQGYLLWWRDGTLVARPFDPVTLQLSGQPRPVADPVGVVVSFARMNVTVSASGTLLYGGSSNLTRLAWFDRTGKSLGTVGDPAAYWPGFRISRDGRQVAATRVDAGRDLWLFELERGVSRRFTLDAGGGFNPLWSDDGQTILYMGDNASNLYRKDASGPGTEQRLIYSQVKEDLWVDWSRDGQFVLLVRSDSVTRNDLWILPVTPDVKVPPNTHPRPYVRTPFNEWAARFSPDSRWVAYQSDKTGQSEIYLDAFPEPRRELRISTAGGSQPRWSASGRELFYRTPAPGNKLMAVRLNPSGDAMEPSSSQELFSLPGNDFDVTADGQRILSPVPADQRPPAPTVIVNWPALLREPVTR